MGASTGRNPTVRHRVAATAAALGLLVVACGDDLTSSDFLAGSDRVRGSGETVAETRSIAEFERIVLAGQGEVLFDTGMAGSVEVETDDNLLTHIRTEVSGDTLTISTEPGIDIAPTSGVTYRLGCPQVTGVVLAGAGTIDLATCVTTDGLQIELPGAGTIVAPEVDASTVRVSLPGAGSVRAAGRSDRLDVVLSGAGDFDGGELRADIVSVESVGVGSCTLWAVDELFVSVTGVGAVRYYGDPDVSSTITGVGTVDALGPK